MDLSYKALDKIDFFKYVNLRGLIFEFSLIHFGFTTNVKGYFSLIPQKVRLQIKELHVEGMYAKSFDFALFPNLQKLQLKKTFCLTANQFNKVSQDLRTLHLCDMIVKDYDFSRLPYLTELYLKEIKELNSLQFNAIPQEVRKKNRKALSG